MSGMIQARGQDKKQKRIICWLGGWDQWEGRKEGEGGND